MQICLPPIDSFIVITDDILFDKIAEGVPYIEWKGPHLPYQARTTAFSLLAGDWFKISTAFYPAKNHTRKHASLSLLYSFGGKKWFKQRLMELKPEKAEAIYGRVFHVGTEHLNGKARFVTTKEEAMAESARLRCVEEVARPTRWELLET